MSGVRHILSFDVEEYFQVEAAAGRIAPADWPSLQQRLQEPVDTILEMLARAGAHATFFILGWVARYEPQVVKAIAAAGHEIASHGSLHIRIHRQTPEQFRQDLKDSRSILEDLCGRAVRGYRAPTFSITQPTAWALDVLSEEGFAYDSSIFPVRHDRYGVPHAPAQPHCAVGPSGGRIIELPPLTMRMLGANWPVGGGGYLRLLPVRLLGRALRLHESHGQSGMVYLHPWELDAEQPQLPLGRVSRWRHRVNLHKTRAKLDWLLKRFKFAGACEVISGLSDLREFRYGPGIAPVPGADNQQTPRMTDKPNAALKGPQPKKKNARRRH